MDVFNDVIKERLDIVKIMDYLNDNLDGGLEVELKKGATSVIGSFEIRNEKDIFKFNKFLIENIGISTMNVTIKRINKALS